MSQVKRIPVQYADKFRLWQELVLAAERQGALFLPVDAVDVAVGDEVDVDVAVSGDGPRATVRARVESFRPASLRFSRGVTIRIAEVDLDRLRRTIGLLPSTGTAAGRLERRYRVRWPLWFRTPAIVRRCLTIDVSEGGMQAEMPERVRRGHVVEFALATPQGHELMMAGEVQWASETERKIGVQFLFPDPETADAFHAMLKFAVRSMGERARSGTVLVVDDEAAAREYMIAALAARGYRVMWSSTGEEALSLARAEKPDLVLMDPRGPRIDAVAICRALRADKELCETPVVFVGGEQDGAEWLQKPVQLRALVATAARHLDEVAA
jgi:CheY-like chemotaxis protein